ncbi:MAG: hypothetical protein IPN74_07455 [Haliscomenobacter sp.]|nr:hypothetical protein [Haliscomenobacter sp.]
MRYFILEFEGEIRGNDNAPWMPFTCEQYNFLEHPTRLFFMNARMKGMPVTGYHHFIDGKAVMDIRLFSLFKVQSAEGTEMDTSETVTFFNDMCCMAPATLIDPRIQWLQSDSSRVLASFSNKGITVSAWLHFNEQGDLGQFYLQRPLRYSGRRYHEKIPVAHSDERFPDYSRRIPVATLRRCGLSVYGRGLPLREVQAEKSDVSLMR